MSLLTRGLTSSYIRIVDKKYLPAKTQKLIDLKPIELEPWDPMGTLAD